MLGLDKTARPVPSTAFSMLRTAVQLCPHLLCWQREWGGESRCPLVTRHCAAVALAIPLPLGAFITFAGVPSSALLCDTLSMACACAQDEVLPPAHMRQLYEAVGGAACPTCRWVEFPQASPCRTCYGPVSQAALPCHAVARLRTVRISACASACAQTGAGPRKPAEC